MAIKKHPWYRKRGYIHFDLPVGKAKAESVVRSPNKIRRHSFWPLINYDIQSVKISRDSTGKLVKKEKIRPISYAAHLDSHIYAYYAKKLEKPYEEAIKEANVDNCVLAFRQLGKSNIDFAKEAFDVIAKTAPVGVVAIDISGFFDNLDHGLLKQCWANLLQRQSLPTDHYAVFRSITRYSKVNREELYSACGISKQNPKSDRKRICAPSDFRSTVRQGGMVRTNSNQFGIPQGTPISALLSNIYMLDFDREMNEIVSEAGGFYFRYCDDMLFIIPEEFMAGVEKTVAENIAGLKLKINPAKTEKRIFNRDSKNHVTTDKPLQYLGFLFDGQRTFIRSAAFARHSQRMKKGVKLAKKTRDKRNSIRFQKGQSMLPLYRGSLYEKYSHLGRRNFIRYGYRAAETMKSSSIRKQLRQLLSISSLNSQPGRIFPLAICLAEMESMVFFANTSEKFIRSNGFLVSRTKYRIGQPFLKGWIIAELLEKFGVIR